MDLARQLQPELYEEVYFTVCFLVVMNFLPKGHLAPRGFEELDHRRHRLLSRYLGPAPAPSVLS